MAGPFDLTGQNIENTYQRILQTPDGVNVYDGTGSAFTVTAVINTSSLVTTSSFNAFTASINQFTSSYNTGSFSGSFTGSLNGTAATASYYIETDPVFVAKSASLATTGSNIFIGDQTISGSLFVYNTSTNNNSLDTLNRVLISSDGITSVDWGGRVLTGNNGKEAIKWGDSRELIDTSRLTSVEWEGRILYANDGTTAHLDWSNPSYMQLGGTTESPIVNVLGIDGGGRIYYTASSAIGGGSGGDFVPSSWTGSAASQFAGTASLASTASSLLPGTYQITSSWATNALTASRVQLSNGDYLAEQGSRFTINASRPVISGSVSVSIWGNNGISLDSQTTVTGDLLPGGPYTNNTSSYSLGSSTKAWKDLYVSNGSVYFISGSNTASISFINGSIDFGGTNVTGVFNSTSSVLGNGLSSSFNINHGFNTRNLHITVYEDATGDIVYPDLKHLNVNTSSITFANPPSLNQYIVYISQ